MAVYKRKGTSIYQIEVKYNGHRVRKSSGTKSKRKAQELERRWMEELHNQVVMGRPTQMSLGEAAERYYNTIILPKSNPRVASREKYMLDKMTSALGKELPLKLLKSPVIAMFRDDLIRKGAPPRSTLSSKPQGHPEPCAQGLGHSGYCATLGSGHQISFTTIHRVST